MDAAAEEDATLSGESAGAETASEEAEENEREAQGSAPEKTE
jgi:hypothetical protein